MALDLRRGYDAADAASAAIDRVNPVGQAFNCAIQAGFADPNPYDGIAYDQLDLWSYDHYHASIAGYYLEALVVFAGITGKDPRTLGKGENAAGDLGLSGEQAARLRSEERSVGKEGVSTGSSRWAPHNQKKKIAKPHTIVIC